MNSLGNDPIRNLPLVIKARNGNRRAATWQVVLTAFGLIAIVSVFFWGINNQRDKTAEQKTASTTGQGAGGLSNDQNDRPQTNGQKTQKTNDRPVDRNGEPAQGQSE